MIKKNDINTIIYILYYIVYIYIYTCAHMFTTTHLFHGKLHHSVFQPLRLVRSWAKLRSVVLKGAESIQITVGLRLVQLVTLVIIGLPAHLTVIYIYIITHLLIYHLFKIPNF